AAVYGSTDFRVDPGAAGQLGPGLRAGRPDGRPARPVPDPAAPAAGGVLRAAAPGAGPGQADPGALLGLADRHRAGRLRQQHRRQPGLGHHLGPAGRHRPDGRPGDDHRRGPGGRRRRRHRGPQEQALRLHRHDHLLHPDRAAGVLVRGAAQGVRRDQGQRVGRPDDPLHRERGVTRHLGVRVGLATAQGPIATPGAADHRARADLVRGLVPVPAGLHARRHVLGIHAVRAGQGPALPQGPAQARPAQRADPDHHGRRARPRRDLRRCGHHRAGLQLERHGQLPDPAGPRAERPQRRARLADRLVVLHRPVQPHRGPSVRGARSAHPAEL
ncbi:MAG: Oligopeptide transport system permease protein OppB, partial [uncultured Corynebacteriales bacterium]